MRTLNWLTIFCTILPLFLAGCDISNPSRKNVPVDQTPLIKNLSFDQALYKAGTESKLVLVLYTDGSTPCRMVEEITFTDRQVEAWLRPRTVIIRVNAIQQPELAERYNVTTVPLLIFLRPDGSEVGRIHGYLKPAVFLKRAPEVVNGNKAG